MVGRAGGSAERPAVFFDSPAEFRCWLEDNHESATELWMGLYKKHVPDRGLTWETAVPKALCFGWIDSVSQRIDADAVRQRWTPRKPTSVWSTVNIAHVERLTAEGKMRPMGIAAFENRTPERSGIYAYEQGSPELTAEHTVLLAASPAAQAFWDEATPSYRKIAASWVNGAKKQETRDARLATLVECCASGVLIPSQRYGTVPKWAERAAEAAAQA